VSYDDVPTNVSNPDEYEQDLALISGVRSGVWLDNQVFAPVHFPVPDVIPEGFSVLAGAPKVGKSWLVMSLCLAVATGGRALGHIKVPEARTVLYLALEDTDRRIQDRVRTLLEGAPIPPNFHYVTQIAHGHVLSTIAAWMRLHPDTSLIVLDTLGKVMPPAMPGETTYSRDYKIGSALKAIVDGYPGSALVVVHHDRKSGSEDFVDNVSGTNGIAGSADTIIVLARERHSKDGIVALTGRDIDETDYALTMVDGTKWQLLGYNMQDAHDAASVVRAEAKASRLGDRMQDVVKAVIELDSPSTPSDIAVLVGIDAKTASVYLSRACEAGLIDKVKRGTYCPLTPRVESVGVLASEAASPYITRDSVVLDEFDFNTPTDTTQTVGALASLNEVVA
jgi:hypothetical protein